MLIQVQDTRTCPGPWYNGLQLCEHINGSYPVPDGSLEQWRAMVRQIRPMRLMWWTNPTYWSVQGGVWAQARANKDSDVGRWFSWGAEDCSGLPTCPGRNVAVPGVGCAQGSWGSEGASTGIESVMASFGSRSYADYLVDAMANSWTRNLGIDGYTEDVSANYHCMLQTGGQGSLGAWRSIVSRVRKLQPQLVMSGEGYSSWEELIAADANIAGQGSNTYHVAMQRAVREGDASGLEPMARSSGADAATVLCYLHSAFDGKQPGGCPTVYFRDMTAGLKDVRSHQLWVALEAGSGIVSQHDYDPTSSCAGWSGCDYWSHGQPGAWWNVTNDPYDPYDAESPLWAFERHRALNRLALRTKLPILHASLLGASASAAQPPSSLPTDGGALVYLKHDAMGPAGESCLMVFNPGAAQRITIDLSSLPASLLADRIVTHDLMRPPRRAPHESERPPPLERAWTVQMAAGQMAAFGGFSLGTFAPRKGKKGSCRPDDSYRRQSNSTTLQSCFLECLADEQCAHVFLAGVRVGYSQAPPIHCTLLGSIRDPSAACTRGIGTLVTKLAHGRPAPPSMPPAAPPTPSMPPAAPPSLSLPVPPALSEYRATLLRERATYNISAVATVDGLPVLNESNRDTYAEWHDYVARIYGGALRYPIDLNQFTWFYFASPLRLSSIYLCDWVDGRPEVPYGTPWTGGLAAWTWGPEHKVRRAGFFVHRRPWQRAAFQDATRLEVMRIGPIEQRGFVETAQTGFWFYHAIGSGIFVRTALFHRLDVTYATSMSVPRTELTCHMTATEVPQASWAKARFWPDELRFELADGSACQSVSRQHRILSCSNLPMPIWTGDDPPPEHACITQSLAVEPARCWAVATPWSCACNDCCAALIANARQSPPQPLFVPPSPPSYTTPPTGAPPQPPMPPPPREHLTVAPGMPPQAPPVDVAVPSMSPQHGSPPSPVAVGARLAPPPASSLLYPLRSEHTEASTGIYVLLAAGLSICFGARCMRLSRWCVGRVGQRRSRASWLARETAPILMEMRATTPKRKAKAESCAAPSALPCACQAR